MESLTKNRQSLDTIRAMVARAYGSSQVPPGTDWVHELGHGWFNVAYRLRLRDGYQAVLKVAPPAGVEVMTYERRAMATELAALALLSSTSSVPVPRVDFADTSGSLVDAGWFVMGYVDADNYGVIRSSLSACEQDRLDVAVGAANRSLNELAGPAFGPLGGPGVRTWRECFLGMVDDVLHDGSRRAVELDHAGLRSLVEAHAACLDEVTSPRFVEWDLWPSNILVRDGRIVGLIDHERAFYGDPLIEAGFVATELPAFGNPTAFVRGYGKARFTANERTRRRLYNLYLTLTMVVEPAYRGYADTPQHHWARSRLAEAVAALT